MIMPHEPRLLWLEGVEATARQNYVSLAIFQLLSSIFFGCGVSRASSIRPGQNCISKMNMTECALIPSKAIGKADE
jgi:hypothetical protein